ncbi:MAG: carbohydrate kinase family protein [Clostridia bacterium]|nr:carbohydrate kinase family protein [Clostridia bacterium]
MKKVTLCGTILLDVVKKIDRWPEKGNLVSILSQSRAVGGAVCNSGVDLKVLDPSVTVCAIGRVGNDEYGKWVVNYLNERGLDTTGVVYSDTAPTSFTDVMTVESTGERTFFTMRGAGSEFSPADVDVEGLDCDIFHLGYLLLMDEMDKDDPEYGTVAARLLAQVQAKGIKTSIDVISEQSDRFERIVRPALKYCDYVVINEIEGGRVANIDPHDENGKLSVANLEKICRRLKEMGVRDTVVIHCPRLSCSVDAEGKFDLLTSVDVPKGYIVGAVGAGDAFCAGMLYGFAMGMSALEAQRVASCASACNLAVADSVSGARSLEETLKMEAIYGREVGKI